MHILPILLLTTIATSLPAAPAGPTTSPLTSALLKLAPSSSSCVGALYPSECRTAAQAAPPILSSFTTYNVTNKAAQAALLATMAFESNEFKYARNKVPGIPGQGGRNMQARKWNVPYANELGVTLDQAQVADGPSFGAAAWFLVRQCPANVLSAFQRNADQGWSAYMACVDAGTDAGREKYWRTAMQVWK